MSTVNSIFKNKMKGMLKYLIFNVVFFGAFFAFGAKDVDAANVDQASVVFHQSNHAGGANNYNAFKAVGECEDGSPSGTCYSDWYVQGTGVTEKDVVTFTLTVPYNNIDGIVLFEEGYTSAGGKSYDAYIKSYNGASGYSWSSSVGGTGNSMKPGAMLDAAACDTVESTIANDNRLVANGGSLYSLMCITEDSTEGSKKIEIKYAYTIRKPGYGLKNIKVVLYYGNAYDPDGDSASQATAYDYELKFVTSKPIDENKFTWIKETGDTCLTHASATGRPETEDICVTYINGTQTNSEKPLTVTLPKETAYLHDVSVDPLTKEEIVNNSIYGTNKFTNVEPDADGRTAVVYYYYAFDHTTSDVMDPGVQYVIVLSIDASGDYLFVIKDVFGNVYDMENKNDGPVDVEDVLKTNIIVDFTNEHNLTIMEATGKHSGDKWINSWEFEIKDTINFKKVAKDSVVVEVHVFHKIVVGNGLHDDDSAEIAKQPLEWDEDGTSEHRNKYPNYYVKGNVQIWRVGDVSGDDKTTADAVSCGTDSEKYCSASNIVFDEGGRFPNSDWYNKILFTVKSNGRYRIMITDSHENTTNDDSRNSATTRGEAKNPYVEVSVVDRTAPIVGTETGTYIDGVLSVSDANASVESFDYVEGGGKVNPVNPSSLSENYWETADNYTTIYYNAAGEKVFDYENAIYLAKLRVLDPVSTYDVGNIEKYYSEYNVNYGYEDVDGACYKFADDTSSKLLAGKYCDPSSASKSDRNGAGTPGTAINNLHKYIIDENLMSFTAGLVIQSVETDYDSTATHSSVNTAKGSDFNYVNSKASDNYAGYLKIVFKNSSGLEICTVANDASVNKSCFNLINQYIDEVEDFSMTFTAQDYMHDGTNDSYMHTSNAYVVNVRVVDNTAPGIIDANAADSINPIKYTNETTACRLEIDNDLQLKDILLDCYLLTVSDAYSFKDNNVNNAAGNNGTLSSLIGGKQYYDIADATNVAYYHNKISLYIKEVGNDDANGDGWIGVDDVADSKPHLKKSGYHEFKVVIADHWNTVDPAIAGGGTAMGDNELTIYLTYYVNPRTLLIEPLATDKMYGEEEPLFDYCVYVNKNNTTFNLEGNFFEVDFINEYFTHIYCTKDVYVEVKDANKYKRTEVTGGAYTYHTYQQDNAGEYLKVNNTYVKIENSKLYTMDYEQKDEGMYFKNDAVNYVEIKSGYLYDDNSCLFAATDGEINGNYIKVPGVTGCHQIVASKRYTPKYTQNNSGTYLKYNENTVSAGYDNKNINNGGNANSALVNSNEFQGNLARVESRCYNKFDDNKFNNTTSANFAALLSCDENSTASDKGVRNDNVGQYHIVLGTLSVEEAAAGGTDYNGDYVIKLNTNYVAATYNLGGTQTITKTEGTRLVDDGLKTESTVNFTIRQAVLTVKANGSSKRFGEQDPYSNVWNNITTEVNNATTKTGYLKGYTISGYRYDGNENDVDSKYIVKGALRRTVGEDVGVYYICNIAGNPTSIDTAKCSSDPVLPTVYDNSKPYYFANYDNYTDGGATTAAALEIRTNGDVYGNGAGRTLNTTTRNYAILFIKAYFTIEATDLIIQPGINQGKEYAATEYKDPLWNFVLYGENVKLSSDGTKWETIIKTCGTINDHDVCANMSDGFSGYTETKTLDVNTVAAELNVAPYDSESEVYYARRKTSPEATYKYIEYIQIDNVQRYIKLEDVATGKYYFYETANTLDNGQYVFAFGNYYEIVAANRYNNAEGGTQSGTGNYLKVEINGRLVNQKDNIFSDDFKTIKDKADGIVRTVGGAVDWYSFVTITNYRELNTTPATIKYTLAKNSKANQCLITETTIKAETDGGASGLTDCINYNIVYRKNAPTKSIVESETIYTTIEGVTPDYAPDGDRACSVEGNYSKVCGANKAEITFEIFKREIILEFIDDNYTFVYGERYDYYDGLTYPSGTAEYNTNTNGIFYVKDGTGGEGSRTGSSERDIFLCYSDLGDYLVDCTNNPDYGITAGHKWTDIGLEFHLHSAVSATDKGYYSTATDKAVPAGEYYVYASINAAAQQNYKFTYRGGTLKIAPKVTNVQLTGYTMEYGESKYASYGIGTNYSEYTMLYNDAQCMLDDSYLSGSGLIGSDATVDSSSCSETGNVVGNKYGFVIEGLDRKDSIANNFSGRPVRESKRSGNKGVFDDVGYYKINVGDIANINDSRVDSSVFKQCVTNIVGVVVGDDTCVFVGTAQNSGLLTSSNAKNYDITYSRDHNEGAYLFILPADVTIEVLPEQAKMYGCAYFEEHVLGNATYYTYTYANGYVAGTRTDESCGEASDYDSAYTYYVTGDKDNSAAKYTVQYDYVNNKLVYTYAETVAERNEIFNGENLYRIIDMGTNNYAYAKANNGKYEGQAVGVYTITLGSLNAKDNINTQMCDAYNNPVLNGGSACRNYNINYYGESATTDDNDHTYFNSINTIKSEELQLYVLNYVEATDASYNDQYVLINGKYVRVADLTRNGDDVLVSTYVSVESLASKRYTRQRKYIEDTNGAYIYLDGSYVLLSSLSDRRYSEAVDDDSKKDVNGNYLRVVRSDRKVNFIQLSTISKFKENTGTGYVACETTKCNYVYIPSTTGEYVYINNEYVQISSLRKYKETAASSGVFVEVSSSDSGLTEATTFVQVFETKALSSLSRFELSSTGNSMYKETSSAGDDNVYVFVNGSYVPYNSFVASSTQTTIVANKATLKTAGTTGPSEGPATIAVKFYITARTVQVHPEYNIRPFGVDDPVEYITCAEIKSAYGLSDFVGREGSYCGGGATKVELGVTMYYAIQNSLAKAPWTAWTDYDGDSTNQYVVDQQRSGYNDLQFDVLKGQVIRRYDPTAESDDKHENDIAGKYTYDFKNVTTVGTLNGNNYMIEYVTEKSLNETYVKTSSSTTEKVSKLLYEVCSLGTNNCAVDTLGIFATSPRDNTKGIKIRGNRFELKVNSVETTANGTPTIPNGSYVLADQNSSGEYISLSLITKYKTSAANVGDEMEYWYQGFYAVDHGAARNGEQAKWWSDGQDENTEENRPFHCSYDSIVNKTCTYEDPTNSSNQIAYGASIDNPKFSSIRAVYFEIIRRTIYLYAVDTSKIYGEADKYSDFKVAICANGDGYVIDGTGIKCKNDTAAYAYGLSPEHKTRFINANGTMNQWKIKSGVSYSDSTAVGPDYMFQGERDYQQSFGIYFRRDEGENAGSYTLTACAAQSNIADCRYKPKEDNPHYDIKWLGDQYDIIEVQGVLTIETRVIDITPDSGQGFEYGNYTENGSMPNITFKETHNNGSTVPGLVFGDGVVLFDSSNNIVKNGTDPVLITPVEDGSGNDTSLFEFTIGSDKYIIDGVHIIKEADNSIVGSVIVTVDNGENTKKLTISGTEYTMIQKARCLISISGLITHCISDGQNEALANTLGTDYWNYPVEYSQLESDNDNDSGDVFDKVCGNAGNCGNYESTGAWKLIKDSTKVYISYNVYADEYSNPLNADTRKETGTGLPDRHSLSMSTCGDGAPDSIYSRDVYEYCITQGSLTVSENVKKQTKLYVYVTPSRRYERSGTEGSYEYTQNDDGEFVKYGSRFIEIDDTKMFARICKTKTVSGVSTVDCQYAKDNSTYTEANGYDEVNENNTVYLEITLENYNYAIGAFEDNKKVTVTAADITVTPVQKQNKIYGEADIEIKFTVQTEYTVARTQYQNFENSNIVKICNGLTCYEGEGLKDFRYKFESNKYVQDDAGAYILLTKGWVVTLDSFAYDEENEADKANNLDYGVGATFEKYGAGTLTLEQNTSTGVKHYDKFTTYKEEINTTRILLGNLYVDSNDQTVGEKNIVSGMKIATNRLGDYYNYTLYFTAGIKFVIVPRPVNVSINNITKVYGQATDAVSCDTLYTTECVVGDGILTAEDNGSLLVNNYSVITRTITDSAIGSGAASTNLVTTTYTDGITVNYTDAKMNMPSVKSAAIGGNYSSFVETTLDKYYTVSGNEEKKNDTLNIKVIRKAESAAISGDGTNKARGNAECLFNGDKNGFCEDVGEYYLYFTYRSENKETWESTVWKAYYGQYWGYNKNYYVIVYNNFEASGWETGEFNAANFVSVNTDRNSYTVDNSATPTESIIPTHSATLKIRKRPTQIVVETISEYNYTQSDTGTHLKIGTKYHMITDTNTYILADDGTTLIQKKMSGSGTYYLCTYATANTASGTPNCHLIEAANRYNLESDVVGSKYSIQQNMDVPTLPGVSNQKNTHHTTYDEVNYKNITWYEHPLQVRTGDNLYGEVAYYDIPYKLTDTCKMDSIRTFKNCTTSPTSNIVIDSAKLHYYNADINIEGSTNFFSTMVDGSYIITRETTKLYIQNGSYTEAHPADGTVGAAYEANNYTTTFINGVLQIDRDETAPIINIETDFIIKEANAGTNVLSGTGAILSFLETDKFRSNKCASLSATRKDYDSDGDGDFDTTVPNECLDAIKFTYENQSKVPTGYGDQYLAWADVMTLIEWFGITSFDPGIIRAGAEVGNTNDRYHARWYMSIQADFNQRKTGNYTIFIYVQDDVGNISLATTVTLRIVDTTKPTVGTLNLYSAQVSCDNDKDCTNEDNWEVKGDVYLSINSIPAANLSYISDETRYMFTTVGGGYYGMVANEHFGTYYKIPAGTNAKAVKHDGWISGYVCDSSGKNCDPTSIYMTITGGDDNSVAFYDIKDYQQYTVGTNTITEATTGTHIVLGSFINVDNLTKYRAVKIDATTGGKEVDNGEATVVYIPDKTGSIIRYKGYYYDLSTASYIGTAPTIDEYKVKLYKKDSGVYTEITTAITYPRATGDSAQYYILDGDLYELPTRRYSADRKYGTGASYTYINKAQWDHYYSRDGGNTWMLYSRDAQKGYLALGEDGQRLIMIKAIDRGFSYDDTEVDKNHVLDAYCNEVGGKTCSEWWGVDVGGVTVKDRNGTELSYEEYVGNKLWKYNVSNWSAYVEGTLDQDRKYAYLDTILPRIQLDDGFTDIFEYGCSDISNCNNNYQEKFGKGIDGYVYKLSELSTYDSSGGNGDTHVRINGKYIPIAGRRYKFDGTSLVLDAAGTYIYVGNISEERLTVGVNNVLDEGNAVIELPADGLFVYDKNSCVTSGEPAVTICKVQITTIPNAINGALLQESNENILSNTKQISSGVGKGQNVFDGITDTTGKEVLDDTFGVQYPKISDKNIRIFIYAEVSGGADAVQGHDFLKGQQYYKFMVALDGTKYKVSYCTSSAAVGEQFWCSSPEIVKDAYNNVREFDTYELAVEAILESYKDSGDADHTNAYNFNGNDIIFSLDYMVFDNAGNASYYQRKIIMIYSFVRYIGVSAGGGTPAAASLSVEVAQNANVANLLNEFGVVTTSGKNLRNDERILQSIYYNGTLISSRAAYDLDSLEMLDTSVPGNYKIVYTIERRDGASYAVGNSVELNVTVTPDVANVVDSAFNYWYIVAIVCGTIAIGLVGLFLNKKRKIEN